MLLKEHLHVVIKNQLELKKKEISLLLKFSDNLISPKLSATFMI